MVYNGKHADKNEHMNDSARKLCQAYMTYERSPQTVSVLWL